MTTDVIRLSGNYKIQTNQGLGGGNITLDITGDDPSTAAKENAVVINGDLYVNGNTVFGNVTNQSIVNTVISDNIITLNDGETAGYVNHSGGYTSGIEIDRGNNASSTLSARLIYNDGLYWDVASTHNRGVWEFQVGSKYSAIKVNAIQYDADAGGIGLDGRLVFFGTQVGMLNVGENGGGFDPDYNPINELSPLMNNYASRVLDPNDIPNKYYVDHVVALTTTTTSAIESKRVKLGDSSIIINDDSVTGFPSNIVVSIDSNPVVFIEQNTVVLSNIAITSATIRTVTSNTDLILLSEGTGNIIANAPIAYQVPDATPIATLNQVKVYSTSTPGAGSSGLKYVNSLGSDELTGARRAMIFGLVL